MNPQRPRRLSPQAYRRRARPRTATGKCPTGKARYPSQDPAWAAALRLSMRVGKPIRAYCCPDCAGWHLTRRTTWKDTP